MSPPALSRPALPHQVLAPLRVSSLRIDGSVDAAERFRRWVERARCACCQAVHCIVRSCAAAAHLVFRLHTLPNVLTTPPAHGLFRCRVQRFNADPTIDVMLLTTQVRL